jgi:hypothetical protein
MDVPEVRKDLADVFLRDIGTEILDDDSDNLDGVFRGVGVGRVGRRTIGDLSSWHAYYNFANYMSR